MKFEVDQEKMKKRTRYVTSSIYHYNFLPFKYKTPVEVFTLLIAIFSMSVNQRLVKALSKIKNILEPYSQCRSCPTSSTFPTHTRMLNTCQKSTSASLDVMKLKDA